MFGAVLVSAVCAWGCAVALWLARARAPLDRSERQAHYDTPLPAPDTGMGSITSATA